MAEDEIVVVRTSLVFVSLGAASWKLVRLVGCGLKPLFRALLA